MLSKRFRHIVILLVSCVTCAVAQDAVIVPDVELERDTIRLQEMPSAAELDQLLLQLVAQQYRDMLEEDDSVAAADTLTAAMVLLRQQQLRDSIELDSLRRLYAALEAEKMIVPDSVPVIRRAIVHDAEEDRADVLRAIRDAKTLWRKQATIMLQMTQTYVSPNWYQGGTSSFALLGIAKGQIGYYGERFVWENTGEWRAGGSTVANDSLRKVNTTDDLLRLYTKANFRIVDKLYASSSAELEARLFRTWKSNSGKEWKTGPFSPLRLNIAVGLDYSPIKGMSISFSPLAYKMVHVMDTVHVKQTEFSVPEGLKTLNDLGSSFRFEYTWKPLREIALESRFYMYTNYRRVELDLELNCDFIINRFLSARLMLHPRYDNTVIYKGNEKAKIQFRELLSIGFAHKFY